MPLPPHEFEFGGGCNCGSIRYNVTVPALTLRPTHPRSDPSSAHEPIRLPYVFTDHCNDCRRATGAILPAWITTHIDTVSVITRASKNGNEDASVHSSGEEIANGTPQSARDVFPHVRPSENRRKTANTETTLTKYESSQDVGRYFCCKCGTPIAWWSRSSPVILDLVLGTVDREFLEGKDMRPERHMFWEDGIGWVKWWVQCTNKGEEGHMSEDVNQRFIIGQTPEETD